MSLSIIIVSLFIGIISLIFYKQKFKNRENDKKSAIILTILTGIITSLGLVMSNMKIEVISLIIGLILDYLISSSVLTEKLKLKDLLKFIGILCLFFASSIFQLIPITIFGIDTNNISPVLNTYLTLFSDLCVAIILIFVYYEPLKKGIKEAKKNFNSFFDDSFKYWIIGFFLMMVSNLCINFLLPEAVAGNENAVQSMIDVSPFAMLVCAGFLAPIIEELTFRQSFREIFKNKWIFIITSGTVFGLLHVIFAATTWVDYIYAIPYAALGISFAYMVDKTDNILSSILMHCIHNTLIILVSISMGMIIL